jgi:hypothetical protein
VPTFIVVVPRVDETPSGRAADMLRRKLPARFPEHSFEFMEPEEAERLGLDGAHEMLFEPLEKQIKSAQTGDLIAQEASLDAHLQVSDFIDRTVAEAKRRAIN